MRFKFFALFVAVFSLVFVVPMNTAFAVPLGGTAVQVLFPVSGLNVNNWLPLIPSTVRGVSGLSVFSSAGQAIEVGFAFAGDPANAEVRQVIIPPAMTQTGAPGAIFYPVPAGYGTRVSIRAVSSVGTAISTGELDLTAYYN